LNDNTSGAQATVEALIKKAYSEGGTPAAVPADTTAPAAPAKGKQADIADPASGDKPTLKRPSP
jgi:hypothetical protein